MRVLFADDQIPHADTAHDERCKAELVREVGQRLTDFERAYQEDYKWFSELVRYLTVDTGLTFLPYHNSTERSKRRRIDRVTTSQSLISLGTATLVYLQTGNKMLDST